MMKINPCERCHRIIRVYSWLSRPVAEGVDTLSSVKQNLHISALYFEKLVTIKRHVVMQ
ncbi:hypothetical protein SAMN05421881_11071, partial [Nitrosomonas halophila]